jgi:hypothetical protein
MRGGITSKSFMVDLINLFEFGKPSDLLFLLFKFYNRSRVLTSGVGWSFS